MRRNPEKVRFDPQLALIEAMEENVTAENITGYFRKCLYSLESREESESEEAASCRPDRVHGGHDSSVKVKYS